MIQPRQHIKLLQIHLDPRGFLQVFLHPSLEQQSFSNLQAPDEEQRPAEALAPPAEDGLEILDGRTQRVQRFWSGIDGMGQKQGPPVLQDLLHGAPKCS
jgi:hypothetical protein